METVIPPGKKEGHVIQKYQFKVLTQGIEEAPSCQEGVQPYAFGELDSGSVEPDTPAPTPPEAGGESPPEEGSPEPEPAETPAPGASEELLKRIDELSTELVKTQMLLEKREAEFAARLEESRSEGYEEGVTAGRSECREEVDRELQPLRERVAAAVEALQRSREQFLHKVDTIEEELIETALDLAKQVVVKEIERNSREVALRLAKLLLSEVKDAAEVTLKVSPEDYDYLVSRFADQPGLTIVSDAAVAPGGVVILSEIGQIDGQIMHRFERIKEAVFGTVQ
ncbi:flagellar assembly protein FliH [Hydrogenimonas sp.]